MNTGETLIKVENVSKKFCRNLKRSLWYGMKDLGRELLGWSYDRKNQLRRDEFWAVKDVSFELKRGECLGLIGRNGAGKTTLLRMLNGLIKPDTGRIEMRGRVGALIALGAGFNPILTGRENIYVNAAVLGFNKNEINQKFDQIVNFAGIDDFIDSPIQHYSSGMHVRLGFSIAAHLNPDILLVDEALAVGDVAFVVRCLNRITELRKGGTAIIFVSHNEIRVREAAQKCILLNKGKGELYKSIDDAFIAYRSLFDNNTTDCGYIFEGPVKITKSTVLNGKRRNNLQTGEDVVICLHCETIKETKQSTIELRVWNSNEQLVSILNSQLCNMKFDLPVGESCFHIHIKKLPVSPGRYRLAGGFRHDTEILGWSWEIAYLHVDKPQKCWMSSGPVMMDAEINFFPKTN